MLKAFVLCCSVAALGTAGTANAQDWTKSKWGPNDEIGAANYITPELVVKAAGLVKTGKTYALGIPVDSKTPAYPPRTFNITVVQPGQAGNSGIGPNKATYNDDILDTWVGIGSQLDGSIPMGATAANLVVAYEPVWAIGTGRTPTLAEIAEVHSFLRGRLRGLIGEEAGGVRILYGGSVKPSNATDIFAVPHVDGALVGGASLKASDFGAIVEALSAA